MILVELRREKHWMHLEFKKQLTVHEILWNLFTTSCHFIEQLLLRLKLEVTCLFWIWKGKEDIEWDLRPDWIPEFENSKTLAFYIIFLKWTVNAYASAEDQKPMQTMVTCFNAVRLWENTLCTYLILQLKGLT